MTFCPSLVGSFSQGAAGNPTPVVMQAAFADLGIDWQYVNCEVAPDQLEAAVAGAAAMGWQGFNCSMPHKQSVIPLLASLSKTAELTQAVNCVCRTANGWEGHNTDGAGFLTALQTVFDVAGSEAIVFGSGGAAYAVAVELAGAGARRISIVSRNSTTSSRLAELIERETATAAETFAWQAIEPTADTTLVVNATPIGSAPRIDETPPILWPDHVAELVVADLVVDPASTAFLAQADQAGATVLDGTEMLVNQAAENVRLWTGERPDLAPLRSALQSVLGQP